MDRIALTAPCGIDCFNCDIHESRLTPELARLVAAKFGIPEAEVPCSGCRAKQGQCLFTGDCPTWRCVERHGVAYCFECPDFPCPLLAPSKEGADRFPHNLKMFNLCRMKAIGVARWASEEADAIRRRYFFGRFIPGLGPVEEKKS